MHIYIIRLVQYMIIYIVKNIRLSNMLRVHNALLPSYFFQSNPYWIIFLSSAMGLRVHAEGNTNIGES